MKYGVSMFLWAMAAYSAQAQNAYEPYAEDVLHAESQEEKAVHTGCAEVLLGGQEILTTNEAQALLCMAKKQLPLALSVMEYGSADRAEVLIGALLQTGVSPKTLGRIATFHDTKKSAAGNVLTLADPHHGKAFYKAWQLAFGHDYARQIRLQKGGDELVLDVDGTISWDTGHYAPTLWIRDNLNEKPQLRVLDPMLSPDRLLSPEEWRALQNAKPAALVWGALGEVPMVMVGYLPQDAVLRLKRYMNIATNEPVNISETNRLLHESSPELRAEIEAEILGISGKAPWHPRNWNAYSFTGGLKGLSGVELPDFNAGSGRLTQQRIEAALQNMELIQAYHDLRSHYADDEAFLQAVKRHLLKNNKKPEYVIINFDDLTVVN